MKGKQRLIDLRRARIMELLSNGHTSQVDIADKVHVSEPTVSRDIKFLKDQARKELETHFQERLPFEYARAMTGINATLARVAQMLDQAKEDKTKIECMKLQMELWKSVMSMATDGGLLERIIKGMKGKESNVKSEDIVKSNFNDSPQSDKEETEEAEEEPTEE